LRSDVLCGLLLAFGMQAAPVQAQTTASCTLAIKADTAPIKEAAVQAFREHRYAEAFGRFARLADAGNAQAAGLALLMLRQGPELFGNQWSASERQQFCWNALAVNHARLTWVPVGNPASD
jgi:hypothetical protein